MSTLIFQPSYLTYSSQVARKSGKASFPYYYTHNANINMNKYIYSTEKILLYAYYTAQFLETYKDISLVFPFFYR